jgi:hypothetical protein
MNKRFLSHDQQVRFHDADLGEASPVTVSCSRCAAQAVAENGTPSPLYAALERLDGQPCALAAVTSDGHLVALVA